MSFPSQPAGEITRNIIWKSSFNLPALGGWSNGDTAAETTGRSPKYNLSAEILTMAVGV